MVIPLGRPLLDGSSDLPESLARRAGTHRRAPVPSLFGLAPCGVCRAPCIAARAVRSYRTFSPLPSACLGRYVFCGTLRRATLKSPSRTLSGTLLSGVRTFLPLSARPRRREPFAARRRPSGPGITSLDYRMVGHAVDTGRRVEDKDFKC